MAHPTQHSPPRHLRIDLPAETSALTDARHAVRGLMHGDGAAYLSDALLLTSELVTNVMLHAGSGCTLSAHFHPSDDHLRVEVSDGSVTIPTLRPCADVDQIGGRGLHLVDRIAHSWGTTPTSAGKTVWFEVGS